MAAIEEFSELGSGIHISMQDLDTAARQFAGRRAEWVYYAIFGWRLHQRILDDAVRES